MSISNDNHNIRSHMAIYEDQIKLISYPSYLLLSWNIALTTKLLLEYILAEAFADLLVKIVLYQEHVPPRSTDFIIKDSNGVLCLPYIQTGIYFSEIIAINSENKSITIKRSEPLSYFQNKMISTENRYHWQQCSDADPFWLDTYSGYTIYE